MEKLGWRPYPSADRHFDRHTNYCEDDNDQHCEIEDYFVDGDGVNTKALNRIFFIIR